MEHTFDALVVGAGYAGSVCARQLAEGGKRVLVLERRDHIGGNEMCIRDRNTPSTQGKVKGILRKIPPSSRGRVRKFPVFRSGAPYGRHGPRKAGGPVSRPYITKRRSF